MGRGTLASRRAGIARRNKSTAGKAQLALKKVNKISRGIEMKHSDTAFTAEVLAAGTSIRFDNIQKGDTATTRTGTRLVPKGLQVSYRVDFDAATTNSSQQCRFIFVQTKTVPGRTVPLVADVIDVATSSLNTLSLYTWEVSRGTRILKDVTHTVAEIAGSPDQIQRRFTIPARKLQEIRYTPGADTIEFGNLGVIMITNDVSTGPIVTLAARLIFTDL